MQASLQQLNTRVGTLETDLRAVKDIVKEIKHSEQIHETRLSFTLQSIYEKLEYIQNDLSGAQIQSRMQEQEEVCMVTCSINKLNEMCTFLVLGSR